MLPYGFAELAGVAGACGALGTGLKSVLHVFAIGLEHTEGQIRHRMDVTLIGNPSPICLHYFQILRVHPHDAVEIGLDALDSSGFCLEDVAIDLVNLLLAQVLQVVFRKLAGSQRKRGDTLNPFKILRPEKKVLEGGARSFNNLFECLPLHVPARLSYQHEFARWLSVCPELLDPNRLPVGIVCAREDVFVFLHGETLDDFGFGKRRRRRRLRYISDARDMMLRRRNQRPLRRILRVQRRSVNGR